MAIIQPISKWFQTKNNNPQFGIRVFYADLSSNQIKWLDQEPSDAITLANFKWIHNVNVCCEKSNLNLLKKSIIIKKKDSFDNIPILKSNLQKCIRRHKTKKALATTIQMLVCHPTSLCQLLRRLAIITIEDVCLNADYGLLVWLMCIISQKNQIFCQYYNDHIKISQWFCQWLIKYVYQLCQTDIADFSENTKEEQEQEIDLIAQIQNFKIGDNRKSLLMSILARNAYGGMKGDMRMLQNCCAQWLDNFAKEKKINQTIDMEIDIDISNIQFTRKTILKQAIDFHCTGILRKIHQKYPHYSKEELKQSIWNNNSSYNKRHGAKPKKDKVWLEIENDYYQIAKKLIHSYY